MVVNHYFEGGAYPIGGSARIAETILPVIQRAGGEVLTNAPVDEVIIKKGRAVGVRLEDGKELFAPVIISNAGVININRLLPEDVANRYGFKQNVKGVEPSVAHMSLSVGCNETADELGLKRRIFGFIPMMTMMRPWITSWQTLITIHCRWLIFRFHQPRIHLLKSVLRQSNSGSGGPGSLRVV